MRSVKAILEVAGRGGEITQAEAGLCVELEARSYAEAHKVSHSEAVRTVLSDGSLPAEISNTYLGREVRVPKPRPLAGVKEVSLWDILHGKVRTHCKQYGLNPQDDRQFLVGLRAVLSNDPAFKRYLQMTLLGGELASLRRDYGMKSE